MNDHSKKAVYSPPGQRYAWVRPGQGVTELMDLPLEPKDQLLRAVVSTISRDRAYPGLGIGLVFRFLGSPRAWQLGGERVLQELTSADREWLVGAALALLSRLKSGEKYFRCVDPEVLYSEAALAIMPARDMSSVNVIEEWYYEDTMPVEFVERIAALGKAQEHRRVG